MVLQRYGKYLFRINHCSGNSAFGNFHRFHDLVRPVQQKHPEFFIRKFAHQGMENRICILASGNLRFDNNLGSISSAGERKHGSNLAGA
ncbi:MAG: hypothetical protein WCI73_08810, partial [Phycisphaerae bacterium]